LTGSGLLLGAVGFASQIPVFLIAPLGGITADRSNRQRVVIATQTASMILALILAALTLTHYVKVWHIYVLAALLGVVNAFDIPGWQSFLVDMVGKDDLMNAIALNSSMFNGARVIGPAVAGVLVARLGEGWCFFANGASYIAVIAGLMLMNVHALARPGSGAAWNPDGRGRSGSTARSVDIGHSHGGKGTGEMGDGLLRGVWREPDPVRHLQIFLDFGAAAVAGGIFHHAADGLVE